MSAGKTTLPDARGSATAPRSPDRLAWPRALWRLVSSLLATGAAATRRDVLRRLTGPDSVIWGLREQFRVMAPAPTLTLSLENRRGLLPADNEAIASPTKVTK